MKKRLYRSRTDRMIWGVCGGLAEYFDIDPTIIRIIFLVLIFANGLSILAYIILAIVVPLEGSKTTEPKEVVKENVAQMRDKAGELGREIRSTLAGEKTQPEEAGMTRRRHNLLGITLIVLGILFLMGSLNLLVWLRWSLLWPVILVAIGLIIIFGARRR
ncbi:MAG TPA: PspC domain-containing protein [Dehalococcoidia bacterium]|jgi:phage shock protein PspC (stress-responsive transcriptional regulator)|nr:PspC domain-containing protein [Dehalococcoidia bacterium]